MIETRRAQRSFGDGLIAEEVKDLHEAWMKHADRVLADKEIVAAIYEALAKRHRQSRTRGRPGALVQIAVTSKRASLLHRGDLKRQVRRSRPQAQLDLERPDVPVRIVPSGCAAVARCRRS